MSVVTILQLLCKSEPALPLYHSSRSAKRQNNTQRLLTAECRV